MKIDQDLPEKVILWARKLERAIFRFMPDACLLKIKKELTPTMFGIINENMISLKLVGRQDVCLLCDITACPWNNRVSHRWLRAFKLTLFNKLMPSKLSNVLDAMMTRTKKKYRDTK